MKIFLAGCESSSMDPPLEARLVTNGFVSYYYLRRKQAAGRDRLKLLREELPNIVIDSGAHTFFSLSDKIDSASNHRAKKKMAETPDEYFAAYLEWVKNNHDLFDYFVELDIGEIVGQQKVERWRERLYALGDQVARKLLPVFHPSNETKELFINRLREVPSGYVGLEGYPGNQVRYNHLELIRACYDRGVRCHGFAMTKMRVFETLPFYSVDSSTFLMPQKYGNAFIIKDNRSIGQLPVTKPKTVEGRTKIAELAKKNDVSLETLARMRGGDRTREAQHEGLRLAARNARVLQNRVTRLWKSRGVDWEGMFNESHIEPEHRH